MRVTKRGGGLRMAEQLADHRKAERRASADARERMPQIVDTEALKPGRLRHGGPWAPQVRPAAGPCRR
jgi:hypothetical protein